MGRTREGGRERGRLRFTNLKGLSEFPLRPTLLEPPQRLHARACAEKILQQVRKIRRRRVKRPHVEKAAKALKIRLQPGAGETETTWRARGGGGVSGSMSHGALWKGSHTLQALMGLAASQ